jgi:hypothetical protein
MAYIGKQPTPVPLTASDLDDDIISLAKMAGGTDGNLITYDASGNPVAVATGSDGQVLTSAGAGNPCLFEAAAGANIIKWYQYTETDTFTISSGGGISDDVIMTSGTITPASTASGFFVMFDLHGGGTGDGPGVIIQYSVNDGTNWSDFGTIGASPGSRVATMGGFGFKNADNDNGTEFTAQGYKVAGIDTANFKVRGVARGDVGMNFNRTQSDLNSAYGYRGVLFLNIWELTTGTATQTAL